MGNDTNNNISTIGEPPKLKKEIQELENTGERFLPGSTHSAEVSYDHFTRYYLAERYVGGKDTIDLGCGAGYGTNQLAKVTSSILGVDLSEGAVAHAAGHYQAAGLSYRAGDVTKLSCGDGSFDAAVSFEVIEHLERPEDLVLEVKRLLKEDGVFVVSTPDKQVYSNERNRVNPHHLKEMYPLEFKELLERNFRHVQVYWQGALAGSAITPDPNELPEDGQAILESAQFSLPDPAFGRKFPTTLYMVAVCTDGEAPEPLQKPLVILDRDRQIYEEYDERPLLLGQMRMHYNYMLNKQRQEADKQLRLANNRLQEADQRWRKKGEEWQETNKQLQKANSELRQLRRLRGEMRDMQSTRGWRVARRINLALAGARRMLGKGK